MNPAAPVTATFMGAHRTTAGASVHRAACARAGTGENARAVESSTPLGGWHARTIHPGRFARVAEAIAEIAPRAPARMLDVGTGDGSLAVEVGRRIGAGSVEGVDVLIRPRTVIPVQAFDGRTLPRASGSAELVTIADVLHHAHDAQALLREAVRVAGDGAVVVKDHFAHGAWSRAVLWGMDVVGNAAAGVPSPGHYFSREAWAALVEGAGARIEELRWPLEIHSRPWRWVAKSEYQFVARLRRR
jgi:SAM-dependent methyltransferase